MNAFFWVALVILLLAAVGIIVWAQAERKRIEQQFRDSIKRVAKDAAFLAAQKIDLSQYAGKWYEIARLPNSFQSDTECRCTTAEYSPMPNGQIDVVNTCWSAGQQAQTKQQAKAIATSWLDATEPSGNSVLRVNFLPQSLQRFSPTAQLLFGGNYWILDIDPEYKTAIVGSPDLQTLWFLARDPQISTGKLDRMKEIARNRGYDVDRLLLSKCV